MRAALTASALVTAIGLAALWLGTDGGRALTSETARRLTVARAPQPVPDALLETMEAEPLALHPGPGQVTIIEFIYTTCPTICQSAGADFARLRDAAVVAGIAHRLRLISLSFDPETDNPALLAAYGEMHGADGTIWTVARPKPSALPELLDSFGVTALPDGWGGFVHNAAIHLINDQGRLASITDIDDVEGAMTAAKGLLQ